jgi:hypothetical protein
MRRARPHRTPWSELDLEQRRTRLAAFRRRQEARVAHDLRRLLIVTWEGER